MIVTKTRIKLINQLLKGVSKGEVRLMGNTHNRKLCYILSLFTDHWSVLVRST